MLRPLDAAEKDAARRWLARRPSHDASADGQTTCKASGDTVILTSPDGERRLRAKGFEVVEPTVSDDGRVAFAGQRDGGTRPVLARVDEQGVGILMEDGLSVHSPDLSPDGRTVAAARCYSVVAVDGAGVRELTKLPHWVDGVEYLPGGRLLAKTDFDVWAAGPVPMLFVVEQDGRFQGIGDFKEAEALGLDVRERLLNGYGAAYPGSSPQQRAEMLERFGYNTASYRVMSPDRRRQVFQMSPKHASLPDGMEGVWVLEAGGGAPRQVHASSDTSPLGRRSLSEVEWSGRGKRAALVLAGSGPDRPVLAAMEGDGSRLRPLPLDFVRDGKPAMLWSGSERYLAFHVRSGDDRVLYCYDAETDRFYPVAPRASLEGWDGDRMRVEMADGTRMTISPTPLPMDQTAGLVLGGDLPREPGRVVLEEDHVDINGVKVPRRPAS